jgi:hypothetical protein
MVILWQNIFTDGKLSFKKTERNLNLNTLKGHFRDNV